MTSWNWFSRRSLKWKRKHDIKRFWWQFNTFGFNSFTDDVSPPERLQFLHRILESCILAQRQAAGHLDVMQQRLTLAVPQFDLHNVEHDYWSALIEQNHSTDFKWKIGSIYWIWYLFPSDLLYVFLLVEGNIVCVMCGSLTLCEGHISPPPHIFHHGI